MAAAGEGAAPKGGSISSSNSSTIDPHLRRCAICTGLSYFKRNKVLALSDSVKTLPQLASNGSVAFICLGRKREVFVKNL
jgi:hypothetical protein